MLKVLDDLLEQYSRSCKAQHFLFYSCHGHQQHLGGSQNSLVRPGSSSPLDSLSIDPMDKRRVSGQPPPVIPPTDFVTEVATEEMEPPSQLLYVSLKAGY